jgi:hypothetical protein
VNLVDLGGRAGSIAEMPAVVLSVIGAGLGFVFEIDHAVGDDEKPRHRVPSAATPLSDGSDEEEESLDSERRASKEG